MLDETPEALIKSRQRSYDRRRNLRPMTSGEMIDLALRIYRSIARPVLAASLPSMLLAGAGIMFLTSFVFPRIAPSGNVDKVHYTEGAFGIVVTLFIVIPLLMLAISYVAALTVPTTSGIVMGTETDMRNVKLNAPAASMRIFRVMLSGFIRSTGILVASLVLFLLAAVGRGSSGGTLGIIGTASGFVTLFAGLIATPIAAYRLSLTPPVALLESESPKTAFDRSVSLVKPYKHIPSLLESQIGLGLILLAGMFFILVGVSTVFAMIPLEPFFRSQVWMGPWADIVIGVLDAIPLLLTIWLLAPLWTIGVTVMYYDRRSRLEAFDIAVLADDVLKVNRTNRPVA